MQNFWDTEPALIIGFVQSAIVLVVSFGVDLTGGQTAAILAITASLLSILTRSRVSPKPVTVEENNVAPVGK